MWYARRWNLISGGMCSSWTWVWYSWFRWTQVWKELTAFRSKLFFTFSFLIFQLFCWEKFIHAWSDHSCFVLAKWAGWKLLIKKALNHVYITHYFGILFAQLKGGQIRKYCRWVWTEITVISGESRLSVWVRGQAQDWKSSLTYSSLGSHYYRETQSKLTLRLRSAFWLEGNLVFISTCKQIH